MTKSRSNDDKDPVLMSIRPIKTKRDYKAALARIDKLMDAKPGMPEGEELDILADLVVVYEHKHFPIDLPDPIAAIKFRMEQQGLSRKDLEPFIGSRGKVSEVLNGKRPLSLAMIRALHENLGIPAEVLLKESGTQKPAPAANIELPSCDSFPTNAK